MIAEERQRTQEELTKVFASEKATKLSKYDRIMAELKEKYADVNPAMLEAIAAKAVAAAIADAKTA